MALMCPSDMTQEMLVQIGRHNLQMTLLTLMGVTECTTWKQLKQQRK